MQQVKVKDGVVEVRSPSIPEKLRLLSKLGLSPSETDKAMSFDMLAGAVEGITPLISRVEVGSITTWEELIANDEYMTEVIEVVSAVLNPKQKQSTKKR
jgi:hypothetical protein